MKQAENKIQQEIFTHFWNAYCLPSCNPREIMYHIPNEGKGNGKLVPLGLYKGASDLVFSWRGITYYCEVKTATGVQSPAQKQFEKHLLQVGLPYFIVRSLDEFNNYFYKNICKDD